MKTGVISFYSKTVCRRFNLFGLNTPPPRACQSKAAGRLRRHSRMLLAGIY